MMYHMMGIFRIGCYGKVPRDSVGDVEQTCNEAFEMLGGQEELEQQLRGVFVEAFTPAQLDSLAVRFVQVTTGHTDEALELGNELAQKNAAIFTALRGEVDAALESALESMLHPDSGHILVRLAAELYEQEHYDTAIVLATRALEHSGGSVEALMVRAKAYKYNGNCAAAVEDLSRVVAAAPERIDAREWRAYCYEEIGRVSEALADFQFVHRRVLDSANSKIDSLMAQTYRDKLDELRSRLSGVDGEGE